MRKPRDPAWKPVDYELPDIAAVKALARGDANEDQQRRALDWIIKIAAGTYEEPYRSDADGGDRETTFALGRAFVGRQIVKLINMPEKVVAQLRKAE